ncbi:hypothetical protein [Flavobacterium johnsoniae]|jgi:flagellar basal body-associated protein FliL|uniref:Uncharacterized protein n=2 Tax=Flavobacterium johnsoniae TaxID=986 RepID=A0A1M5TG64_FLAJO|nr:hypothetical protein [Flavobacterium johnsoniae]ABQ03620.1 hypothetical protein Fjoh_0585 [Flavobacterium johnsoniae UW101]OXE96039.1 hypothetical protein B0A63_23035 [Flavobacterium johnsoniae UW101]WQG79516.1 hypothetical protein SR927_15960 [Flavobacterium johnsoniae UW101]SHH49353.1 hypothetical protein SAMN05444388_111106 [Flavobacterium johnsoniae]SHL97251.1 hypothetical protein SAMN05444146_5093 [Flavobacterium johnsoniae]
MEEKQNKRKQNVLLLVVIGIALALAVFFQFFLSEKSDEVKTEVTELVEKYNKSCPLKIQEGIRLENVTLTKERVVQYNLTLTNVEKATAETDVIQEEIEKSLLSTAKANPGLQVFRDNDYTLVYSYSDKKKAFLFDITILPDQYK